MKLQATSVLQKGLPRKCLSVNFVNFSRIPFLKNLSGRLLLTLQVHKVDKKVSRYCKKNIKLMSTEGLLVNLSQLWKCFFTVRKLSNHHSEKLTKTSKVLQEKYLRWSFVLVKRFFLQFHWVLLMTLKLMILWNFISKLHIQSPVEKLRWSFFVIMINVLRRLVILARALHRGYLTRF